MTKRAPGGTQNGVSHGIMNSLTHIKAGWVRWVLRWTHGQMKNEPLLIELDARGFEPPQPMQKALEAVATLPANATLFLHTCWRPALLYPELQKRGFIGESFDQPDGSCITHIRHG